LKELNEGTGGSGENEIKEIEKKHKNTSFITSEQYR
jgi:hypothetical protein